MKGLPRPISFSDTAQMDRFLTLINSQIDQICERYGETDLPPRIKILRNTNTNTVEFLSMGTYVSGSNTERAINEIIDRVEAIVGG